MIELPAASVPLSLGYSPLHSYRFHNPPLLLSLLVRSCSTVLRTLPLAQLSIPSKAPYPSTRSLLTLCSLFPHGPRQVPAEPLVTLIFIDSPSPEPFIVFVRQGHCVTKMYHTSCLGGGGMTGEVGCRVSSNQDRSRNRRLCLGPCVLDIHSRQRVLELFRPSVVFSQENDGSYISRE